MKKIGILIMYELLFFLSVGQEVAPGAVKGFTHWYVTDASSSTPSFKSNITSISSFPLAHHSSLGISGFNNYPSLVFSTTSELKIPLQGEDLTNSTYFTVYQPFNLSSENIIWHKQKDAKTDLVLTTSRMADLAESKYMNYTDVFPLHPKVHYYVQQKIRDSIAPVSQFLHIGRKPDFPLLPITTFQGLLPEIIIYNRVLDWQEQLRVASYLALKYGITLTEPGAKYLNSSGEEIWNGEAHTLYHHNIAGIARDDSSGLFQKSASSSNSPNLLTISTNDSLSNKSFLLWGDNGLGLGPGEKIVGVPPLLQKKWIVVPHGLHDSMTTTITLDTKEIDISTPAKPVYWLAIDRTGKGDFSLSTTEYFKMRNLSSDGKAHFLNIALNKSASGKEIFGFVVGQELLSSSVITSPSCTDPNSGSLLIKTWGGEPPFQVRVVKDGTQVLRELTLMSKEDISISGLTSGKYAIHITDKFQHTYTDEFYVNNYDAPLITNLASTYVLPERRHLDIQLESQPKNNVSYLWTSPDGSESSLSTVTLTLPGKYTIKSSKDGCSRTHDFSVTRPPKNIFTDISVYPNPSNGAFKVKIALDKPSAVNMDVYTEDGRLVMKKALKGFAHYLFSTELSSNGIYFLVFTSHLATTTRKIIVAR